MRNFKNDSPATLINPDSGRLGFKITGFDESTYDHIQRLSHFSIIWLTEGKAHLKADFNEYQLSENSMMFFSPYQPFMIKGEESFGGVSIYFHSDFFCIYQYDKEVTCNGSLFNNVYHPPYIEVDQNASVEFESLLTQIREEMTHNKVSQTELLISYLKIFLIKAVRLKASQIPELGKEAAEAKEPFVLQQLKEHIEQHYKTERQPAFYASLVNISPKALGKLAKQHFDRTLTDLIAERIIIEAKRELYLTFKPIKAIAYDLGFEDEFHFSRYFKNHTDISPLFYRETVGAGALEKLKARTSK